MTLKQKDNLDLFHMSQSTIFRLNGSGLHSEHSPTPRAKNFNRGNSETSRRWASPTSNFGASPRHLSCEGGCGQYSTRGNASFKYLHKRWSISHIEVFMPQLQPIGQGQIC